MQNAAGPTSAFFGQAAFPEEGENKMAQATRNARSKLQVISPLELDSLGLRGQG